MLRRFRLFGFGFTIVLAVVFQFLLISSAHAQDDQLKILTIERPPFSYVEDGQPTGFSVELMQKIAVELEREVEFQFVNEFADMLDAVERGEVDGAIANISITSAREAKMDFSQPIYESGLRIMTKKSNTDPSIWSVLARWELVYLVGAGFGILFLLGMLMWMLERKKQPYFQLGAREAMFPSFWWALNLVINGGFEVTMPRTVLGRLLGVMMVVSSLFVVSLFVANITAALTVKAIQGSIQTLQDLNDRRAGTTQGSTATAFLESKDVAHKKFASYRDLIDAFENDELDAVFFDGPILSFYVTNVADGDAFLLDQIFRQEDYGIALPQGSELREPINRVLLRMVESGEYSELDESWFGKP